MGKVSFVCVLILKGMFGSIMTSDQILLQEFISNSQCACHAPQMFPSAPQFFLQNRIWGAVENRPKYSPKPLFRNFLPAPVPHTTFQELFSCSYSPNHFSGTLILFLFLKDLRRNIINAPITQKTFQEHQSCSCSPMFFRELGNYSPSLGNMLA